MKKQIRVLLADDHQMFRESLVGFLADEFFCKEVLGVSTVAEARKAIEEEAPEVAVCDLNFPGEESGYDLIAWIQECRPEIGVVCLTMHSELQVLREAAKLGARGFVTKSSGYNELFRAIRAVAEGGYYLDQVLLEKVMKDLGRTPGQSRRADDDSFDRHSWHSRHASHADEDPLEMLADLTPREREIFLLFARDATIFQVAEQLYLSPKTVENHRSSIYRKLGLHDRLSLLRFAREHRLLE